MILCSLLDDKDCDVINDSERLICLIIIGGMIKSKTGAM